MTPRQSIHLEFLDGTHRHVPFNSSADWEAALAVPRVKRRWTHAVDFCTDPVRELQRETDLAETMGLKSLFLVTPLGKTRPVVPPVQTTTTALALDQSGASVLESERREPPMGAPNRSIYRFIDTTAKKNLPRNSAVLNSDGSLQLLDASGTMETYHDYREFMKKILGMDSAGSIEDDLPSLEAALGPSESIEDDMASATKKPTAKKAPAAKPAPVAKAATNGRPVKKAAVQIEPADLPLCGCGCEDHVLNPKRQFLQGHDARFHGYISKYQKGKLKFSELNPTVQKYVRKEGIKPHAE